jgi:hypothetical protein
MAGTARRVLRCLQKRGLENEDYPLATDDPLLATLMSASIRSRIATAPKRANLGSVSVIASN